LRLLLDTHAFIWWIEDIPFETAALDAIADPDSDVFVSAASIWEAEIKVATGKLRLATDLIDELRINGFGDVAVSPSHAVAAARLPQHHRDPFDRMLVAQAQLEGLTLVTRDPVFDDYSVAVLKA
jgi:PIN domain nuclease of toxin-antitoxin system